MEIDSALIQKSIGKNFIFHSNFNLKIFRLKTFPEYYRKKVAALKESFSHISDTNSGIQSDFHGVLLETLWFSQM